MEGDHVVECDTVWPFAEADCFSIFTMSAVLSFCYIKKDIFLSRIGGTVARTACKTAKKH